MKSTPSLNLSALNPIKRDRKDVAKAYARLFAGDDGKIVLQHLHDMAVFCPSDPNEAEAALRHREGKRALLLAIVRMIETGMTG